MADRKPTVQYLEPIDRQDPAARKAALLEVLDMLRNQVEAGNIESLVVLFAADKDGGDRVTFGGRHVVRARHMDFLEDAFLEAMQAVTDRTGVTAHSMREARAEALERMREDRGE